MPGIDDFDAQPAGAVAGFFILRADGDPAAARGELHGVPQKVPDDLLEAGRIRDRGRNGAPQNSRWMEMLFARASSRTISIARPMSEWASHGWRPDVELAAGDAGEIEEVIDEPGFERDIALHHPKLLPHFRRQASHPRARPPPS